VIALRKGVERGKHARPLWTLRLLRWFQLWLRRLDRTRLEYIEAWYSETGQRGVKLLLLGTVWFALNIALFLVLLVQLYI
jgi:hypothetical protein